MVRTKSGRMIEKTILVSKAEYEELQRITKEGGDPTKVCLYVPMCSSAYYWLVLRPALIVHIGNRLKIGHCFMMSCMPNLLPTQIQLKI